MTDSPHDRWVHKTFGTNPATYAKNGPDDPPAPAAAAQAAPAPPAEPPPHQDPPATTPTSGLYQGAGAAGAGHGGANVNGSIVQTAGGDAGFALATTVNFGLIPSPPNNPGPLNAEILVGANRQWDGQGHPAGGSESVAAHGSAASGTTTGSVYVAGQHIEGQNPASRRDDVNGAGTVTVGVEQQLGGRDGQPAVVLGGAGYVGMQRYLSLPTPGSAGPPTVTDGATLAGAVFNAQFNTGFHPHSTTPTNTIFGEIALAYAGGRALDSGVSASSITTTAAVGLSHNIRLDNQGRAVTISGWLLGGRQDVTAGGSSSSVWSGGVGVGIGGTL